MTHEVPDPRSSRALSDLCLLTAFRSTDPKLTRFPHCIFESGSKPLEVIARVVGEPVGIWGNAKPAIDERGDAYLEPEDSRITDDFKLWAMDTNQIRAMDYGGRLPSFIAAIPANTPVRMLDRMYSADHGSDEFEYDKCIVLLADWIEDLGWAYVPLEYEAEYAIFVVASRNQRLVARAEEALAAEGIAPVFRVVPIDGGQEWRGPLYLDIDAFG